MKGRAKQRQLSSFWELRYLKQERNITTFGQGSAAHKICSAFKLAGHVPSSSCIAKSQKKHKPKYQSGDLTRNQSWSHQWSQSDQSLGKRNDLFLMLFSVRCQVTRSVTVFPFVPYVVWQTAAAGDGHARLTVTAGDSNLHPSHCTRLLLPLCLDSSRLLWDCKDLQWRESSGLWGPELSDQALFRFCFVLHSYNLEVRFLISINRNDPVVLEVLNHWSCERERLPE